jgi:TonB-dependent SusC/RagA subfamily outer membrane receptor
MTGEPIPFANVVAEKNGNQIGGTTTDFDGNYSIMASEGDVLSVSYVGYAAQTVTVGTSTTINVTLNLDNTLEEVVVTALGITREAKSLGYAQQKVTGDALTKTKETDFKTALAGKVAGVQVITGTSSTYEPSAIRLRGEMDILYVVDGIKVASTDINTDNIDNITVLKGAAATALYGSEAKSGVIVITSKKAKAGESYISVDQILQFQMFQDFTHIKMSMEVDITKIGINLLTTQLLIQLHGPHLMDKTFLTMQQMNRGDLN